MKILLSLVLLTIPALVSAQTASNTLSLVQNLSVSAGSSLDLENARLDAGKSFDGDYDKPGHGNNGHNGGNHPGVSHPTPYHPPKPPKPLVVVQPQPHHPPVYNPYPHYPHYPPVYDPYPDYPHYPPVVINPYPHHHDTVPVVTTPMDAKAIAITIGVIVAVVLLLVLI